MTNIVLFFLAIPLLIKPLASFAYSLEIGLEGLADQIVSEVGKSSKGVVFFTGKQRERRSSLPESF